MSSVTRSRMAKARTSAARPAAASQPITWSSGRALRRGTCHGPHAAWKAAQQRETASGEWKGAAAGAVAPLPCPADLQAHQAELCQPGGGCLVQAEAALHLRRRLAGGQGMHGQGMCAAAEGGAVQGRDCSLGNMQHRIVQAT